MIIHDWPTVDLYISYKETIKDYQLKWIICNRFKPFRIFYFFVGKL